MSDKTSESNEYDVNSVLMRHLSEEGQIRQISLNFASLTTNSERVDFVYELLERRNLLPRLVKDGKNNEISVKCRERGNQMFKIRKCGKALEWYTKSALMAEDGSESLGLAYANRSAVLFEKGLYKECLLDIERALDNKYPDSLKGKLLSRKEKATTALDGQHFHITYATPIPTIPEECRNPSIQCASNAIKIEHTPELGRHIVATRDIEVGEILAIETPYCHILIEQFNDHCHHCLKTCYNPIPCARCTQTLFCGKRCEQDAYVYHKYECPIIVTTKKLDMDKLKLLPMRIALLAAKSFSSAECQTQSEEYRSDRYKEIHNLVGNTESRTVADIFDRAVTATVIFYLIKKYTDFFENCENTALEGVFKNMILLHLQTGACNFHEINESRNIRTAVNYIEELGAGAYAFLSMFNHSCSPNLTRYSYGCVSVARAIQSISKGEQCCDNYGQHFAVMDKSSRQKKLAKQYFFDCKCVACTNDYPLYHELPWYPTVPETEAGDFLKLKSDSFEDIKELQEAVTGRIKTVEKFTKDKRPNKNLADLQEVLKQCYFSLSNIDTPFLD